MQEEYRVLRRWSHSPSQKMYLVMDGRHRIRMKKELPAEVFSLYRKLLSVKHKHLVQVMDVWQEGDSCVVIEEFVNGSTISEYMRQRDWDCLPPEMAISVVEAVCEGLERLHRLGIIHRDIKPENLMLTNDFIVKICDYNIARSYREEVGKDTRIFGTQGFAPPEQFGFRQTDARSDIYAVGVLLNVFLTGDIPQVNLYQGIEKIQRIILRATAVEPSERYADIRCMKKDLQKVRHRICRRQARENERKQGT